MAQRPIEIAVYQVEEVNTEELPERFPADEWYFGDEDTEFRGSYVYEYYYEDEEDWNMGDEAYAAAKRTSVEMESDDIDNREVYRRDFRPIKARKGLTKAARVDKLSQTKSKKDRKRSVGWSNRSLDITPCGALPLVSAIKSRGAPPVLKPRGMGDQEQ